MVRIFPNPEACLRLVTALAVEQSEEWVTGRRYLDMGELQEHRRRERKPRRWRSWGVRRNRAWRKLQKNRENDRVYSSDKLSLRH